MIDILRKTIFIILFLVFLSFGTPQSSFAEIKRPILPVKLPDLPTLPPIRISLVPPPVVNPKNKIDWVTPYTSLSADDFYIIADGKKYYGKADDLKLNSDPPTPPITDYTSLEAIWHENGKEMRIFIYFDANTKTRSWNSTEFRTYDGQSYGNWIYYYGNFFTSRLGRPFIKYGNLDINSSKSDSGVSGSVHFENLRLQAFFPYLTVR